MENETDSKLIQISKSHIDFIKKQNIQKNSSSKNFYILINFISEFNEENFQLKIIKEDLKEKFFKIKESLSRCGNLVFEVESKKEVENIMYSFLNSRKSLKFIS